MRSLKLGLLEPGAHGFEMCQEERVDGKAGETLRGHGLRTVLPSTLVTQLRFREREGQAQKEPAQKPHHPGQPRVHGSPTPTHRHTQHQCAHTDTQAHGTNTQSHTPKTDSHTPAHDPSLTQTHTYAQMLTPQRHTTYMAHTIQTHMGSCTYLQTYTEKHTCSPTLEHKWLYPHACSHSHSCTKLAQVSRHTHSCAFNTHTHTPLQRNPHACPHPSPINTHTQQTTCAVAPTSTHGRSRTQRHSQAQRIPHTQHTRDVHILTDILGNPCAPAHPGRCIQILTHTQTRADICTHVCLGMYLTHVPRHSSIQVQSHACTPRVCIHTPYVHRYTTTATCAHTHVSLTHLYKCTLYACTHSHTCAYAHSCTHQLVCTHTHTTLPA